MTVLFEFKATGHMDESFRQQTCEWLTSLGFDPRNVRDGHVVREAGGYELHLTEMLRDADGRLRLDDAHPGEIATATRVVQLGSVANWPSACSACAEERPSGDQQGDDSPRS